MDDGRGKLCQKMAWKRFEGKEKKHVAAEIAQKMNAAKVRVSRDAKQVMNKIAHIEKSFRSAHDFANSETGQGLKESNWGEFDDAVRSKCPFYFDLLDIFGDRASAKPKATSNESLESSDDDKLNNKINDLDTFSVEMNDDSDDDDVSAFGSEACEENNEDKDCAEGDADNSTQDNGAKEKNVKHQRKDQKLKRRESSSPSTGTAASSKKSRNINILDAATSDSLSSLAATQNKLALAKLERIKHERMEMDLKLRMQKFHMLHEIRQKDPSLTNEQICAMFPELADFVQILNNHSV